MKSLLLLKLTKNPMAIVPQTFQRDKQRPPPTNGDGSHVREEMTVGDVVFNIVSSRAGTNFIFLVRLKIFNYVLEQ